MFAPKVAKPQTNTGEGPTSGRAPHSTSVAHPLGHNPLGQMVSGSDQEQQTRGVSRPFSTIPIFPDDAAPSDVRSVLNEPGHPLDAAARTDFQTTFGHDFSSVRVHTDEQAAASAASRSARAFTMGNHVVFGRGEYSPGTPTGRHLLGHELAHVVQQSRGGPSVSGEHSISLEAAADQAANQASRGAPVLVTGSSAVGIARKTIFEEFTGGKYVWALLEDALKATRPVASIVADVNGLTAPEREQAITDITKERVDRACKHAFKSGQQSALTDPKARAVFDPELAAGQRILDRFDAVLDGLAPAGTVRRQIPGWNFTPEDFAKLKGAQKDLTIAPESGWFPAKLQENLLKTLAFVLGPTVPVVANPLIAPATNFCRATKISPTATEGVNALDFFHGHLVTKRDKAIDKEAKAMAKTGEKFEKDLGKARKKAVGGTSYTTGYRMDDKKIAAYKATLEKVQPSLASLMEAAMKIPGAAVLYHTFEYNNPYDLKVKGQTLASDNPRRHYVTPLDTNTPGQYTPPLWPETYEKDFHHVVRFSFLVDTQGAVHVRPLETGTTFTTLELSTITGTTFPEPLEFDK